MLNTPRILSCGLLLVGSFLVPAAHSADDKIDFAHDVVPLLRKHCVECHGGRESKGGFSINTRELILDAAAAVPSDAARSVIVELVTSTDPELRMPPVTKPGLTAAEIGVLKRWIEQGLRWEDGFTFALSRYEPPLKPRRPELPAPVAGRTSPVDRIVDACFSDTQQSRPEAISDAAFLRRVSLDITGLLPEPEVLEAFLNDTRSDKRERMIDELLDNDVAYTEHWLTFWNDLLRNDYSGTGFITGGRKQITSWLYRSLIDNKPYDQLVRELLDPTPESVGFVTGIRWRGNVNSSQTPELQFAQNVSQAFLGINLKCASCHDSFIDRWTLEETYALAQVYSTTPLTLHRCDKPTGQTAKAGWLFPELGEINADAPQPERLKQLATLMTHPENGRFTRTIVNRIWHRLMGRGIVHPVDAMHTAPWSADLLDYLAVHFADQKYDLKQTIRLICVSGIYQAQTPPLSESPDGPEYVFAGPLPRRMTAEQFMDSVWQLTSASPTRFDAQVVRAKYEATSPAPETTELTGRWIWAYPEAATGKPQGGEIFTARREFELKTVPVRAVVALTCDNEYTIFVNGRNAGADTNWENVELIGLQNLLKVGKNEVLIVAENGGSGGNPAGLIAEFRLTNNDDSQVVIGTDTQWQWTSSQPDARGRFRGPAQDWKPAELIASPGVWAGTVEPQMKSLLSGASGAAVQMVRASLVKADELMRALGRPNRDQIVTSRPSELTTLEAIDLANGQRLADSIASGARFALNRFEGESDKLIQWLYRFAMSRPPTDDERRLASEFLGENPEQQSVEDLLWAVVMQPEFQLVR
jgi:hypothetical protein